MLSVYELAIQIYASQFHALTRKMIEEILLDEKACEEIKIEARKVLVLLGRQGLDCDLPHPEEYLSAYNIPFDSQDTGMIDAILYLLQYNDPFDGPASEIEKFLERARNLREASIIRDPAVLRALEN